MPSRNKIKEYIPNAHYHIYNRGAKKTAIFLTKKDQSRFLKYLSDGATRFGVQVLQYALMKNHFHLVVKQSSERGIEKLMRSCATRYALYFNYKYDESGYLFQGIYRARRIGNESQMKVLRNYLENHSGENWEVEDWDLDNINVL